MDGKEKLNLFQNLVFEHTEKSVAEQLATFEASLLKVNQNHQNEQKQKDKIVLTTEEDNLRKERNKKHAQLQLKLQRELHVEQQKLQADVFNRVNLKLEEYMQTEDYIDLLERQINQTIGIAKDEEVRIYLDPTDEDKLRDLEKRTNHELLISDRSFIGGIRGVISSRNMLIDQSFLKRLEKERENFSFDVIEEEADR